VFAARREDFSAERPVTQSWSDLAGLVGTLGRHGNDLTEAAVSLRPVIGEVLAALRTTGEARHVAMSGSGATCFALYATLAEAKDAAVRLPATWWRHAGTFVSG
jgi:4-diphosphocytidyl-2-C-methyl-D-erythritol kinase